MNDKDQPPRAVRIDRWGYSEEDEPEGRGVSLLGILLIALGFIMLAGDFLKAGQIIGPAFFLVIGLALLVVWLRDRGDVALYAGIFLTALSLADLLTGLGVIQGPGWGPLFLAIGVLALVPLRMRAGRGWGGAAVLAILLAIWGGSEVAGHYLAFPADQVMWPLVLVFAGLCLVLRAARS
jgi:hypothetical protein